MPWRFRKVIGAGLVRINLSRRGVGSSFGIPGLRLTVAADGRRYITIGIPGTGVYWQQTIGRRQVSHAPAQPSLPPTPSPVHPPASTPPPSPKVPWWKQKGI